jgi:hypothetical protein
VADGELLKKDVETGAGETETFGVNALLMVPEGSELFTPTWKRLE